MWLPSARWRRAPPSIRSWDEGWVAQYTYTPISSFLSFFPPSLSLLNRGEIIVYVMFSEEAARLAEKVQWFLPFISSLYKLVVIIALMILKPITSTFPLKPHTHLSLSFNSTDMGCLSNWHLIRLALIKYACIMARLEMTKFVPFEDWEKNGTTEPC